MARKTIKRGKFVRLPNGAGSIKIERGGEVIYKAPAKRKNPTKRSTRKRASRALASWVRGEIAAGRTVKRGKSLDRKKNGAKKTARKKIAKRGRKR
jgi:hypothetical protein